MKAVLVGFALLLLGAAYELERAASAEADARVRMELGRLLELHPDHGSVALRPELPPGEAGTLLIPYGADTEPPAGSAGPENSIRLLGPGVSRRQQIRV